MLAWIRARRNFQKSLQILLIASLLYCPLSMGIGSSVPNAYATHDENKQHEVFLFFDVEDPRLIELIPKIKGMIKILFTMLYSFEWLTHPRKFYRKLKEVFQLWFKLMSTLFKILLEYINELEGHIGNSFCEDRDCDNVKA